MEDAPPCPPAANTNALGVTLPVLPSRVVYSLSAGLPAGPVTCSDQAVDRLYMVRRQALDLTEVLQILFHLKG